ncbi:hypothetical protein [Celeribacter baekdonensis]|uniref:hypothetical protein n=1 Tax=Pseudomonadota TaxID=1224 RepID=UPI003A8DE774
MLRARAADAKAAPLFERAKMAGDLVDDVTGFLVDLSACVDELAKGGDHGNAS